MNKLKKKFRLSSSQVIIGGFALMIFIGAVLLYMPFSTVEKGSAPFIDCLFTSASASCVTGLVVHDTATYWTAFGKTVILLLIQIGGMGVVTMAVLVTMMAGKKISLSQRSVLQDSISAHQLGGIVKAARDIVLTSLGIELAGAVLLYPSFAKEFGYFDGIIYAIWHSISAFCNAGFDLMGVKEQYSSLTAFTGNPTVNITIMLLIVIGGIGFLTWNDIKLYKFKFRKYKLQSKLALCTTRALILGGFVYFYIFEYSQRKFGDLTTGEKIWGALFQSITTRTAGFNTTDLTKLSEAGQLITIILMLIGGTSGSTAGGMKTTTFAVLIITCIAVFRKKDDVTAFNRRISADTVRTASTIFTMYILLFVLSGIAISISEGLPLLTCLFETASAIGTVGLTLGITPSLHFFSKCVIIMLMYFGRVGALTIIYATLKNSDNLYRYPEEKVTVG